MGNGILFVDTESNVWTWVGAVSETMSRNTDCTILYSGQAPNFNTLQGYYLLLFAKKQVRKRNLLRGDKDTGT